MTKQGVLFSFAQSLAWTLIAGLLATAAPARARIQLDAAGSRPIAVPAQLPAPVAASAESKARPTSAGSWTAFPGSTQGCDGIVYAMAASPDGRIAVGGDFSICGGVPANNVAIYDPASDRWTALGGGIGATPSSYAQVYTLAWFRGELFVGGEFAHAGGVAIADLARWDGNAWSGFGLAGFETTTRALAASGDYLYVGGTFDEIGGVAAHGVARWDGDSWSSFGVVTSVFAIAVIGTDVYFGGSFLVAGGVAAKRVALWNGRHWAGLGDGIAGPSGTVYAMAGFGGELYVGGQFSQIGGVSMRNISRWNGIAWSALEGNGTNGVNGAVRTLAVSNNQLVVGGRFSQVAGTLFSRLARWSGTEWSPFTPELSSTVETLIVSNNVLYAGGFFRYAGGAPADAIARFDADSWSALGPAPGPSNGVNGTVLDFATIGQDIFLCGWFTQAGAGTISNIARLSAGAWTGLGIGNEQLATNLMSAGAELYAGGHIWSMGTVIANKLARWDGATWNALGSGIGVANSANDGVYAMVMFKGELYAGGTFTLAGGQPARNLARWDGSVWTPLSVGTITNGQGVYTMAASASYLYIGGSFSSVDGIAVRNIARFDGTNWSSLTGTTAQGVDDSVLTILPSGNDVYVGGRFTEAGGNSIKYVARWDGNEWFALGAGVGPLNSQNSVVALAEHDGALYVGGSFGTAGGLPANNLASWSAGTWRSVGDDGENGLDGPVGALAILGNTLHVGGSFLHAGSQLSTRYAQWVIPEIPLFGSGFEVALQQ